MGPSSPAGQLSRIAIEGDFRNAEKVKELAKISDVLTTEIEHVDVDAVLDLEKDGYTVRPNARTIRLIQDKYAQKIYLNDFDISLPEFMETATLEQAREAGLKFGYPFMLKNRMGAYDGRGNALVREESQLEAAFNSLGGRLLYAEKFIPFIKELAVMVVRTVDGVKSFPVVETIQQNNICHIVIAPAQISQTASQNAMAVASRAIAAFDGVGIYGVELFLLNDDTVLLNEIAPR